VKPLGILSLLAMLAVCSNAQEQSMPLDVVPSVDLDRYMGTWHEIARLPNWFQKKCSGDVSATYTLLDDGTIQVINRCRKEDGRITEAEGRAKRADKNEPNTKLKVRFAPRVLSFLPFVWGNYWIIDLAPDYSYVVVGEPSRKYLWILSRTPDMDETILQTVLVQIKTKGYDLSGLIRTEQAEK